MSSITGILYRDGRSINPEIIKKMNDCLSHRGPDGSALWNNETVAFGHQMLYTTKESLHEILPFYDIKTDLTITADARIDNRNDLAIELDIEDNEKISDSYFILKSYEKWGENCPKHLLGDFVFVIWDNNENKLFCARDHMGVKPFYYYLNKNIFVFSTEIKALFRLSEVPKELNEKKLALYLNRDILDKENTFYKDIKSLPGAHSLIITSKELKKEIYWKLDPSLNIEMNSEEEYANTFREIFAEAVRCRLRSYYPIGFELSGGLDSSSIVCIAKKILTRQDENLEINTFSRVYNEIPESDESFYIQKVIETGNINPTFLNGDELSPLKDIENILWHQDQPFFSPNMTAQMNSYNNMNDKGIRILLSGEGGDEIVSSLGYYLRELLLNFNWGIFIQELDGNSKKFDQNKYKIFINEIIFPSTPYFIKKLIKILFNKNPNILNEDFLKSIDWHDEKDIFLDHLGKLNTKDYHYFSINNPLSQTIFGIIDRSASISNIEERFPFYDKRIVEFCYSLPIEMKIKYGWERYIMRLAMQDILPKEIQWRKQKANLSHMYKRNLLLYEEEALETIIYEDHKIIEKYVNLNNIRNIFENYKSGKKENLFDFWLVILIYYWIKNSQIVS
jgi:asparagine synthase (glutamine-hydrolysing)